MVVSDVAVAFFSSSIASGEKVGSAIELEAGLSLVNALIPSLTTSTKINFDVSSDGINYYPLYNDGTLYAVTVAAATAQAIALDENIFRGWRYIIPKVADNQTGVKEFFFGAKVNF